MNPNKNIMIKITLTILLLSGFLMAKSQDFYSIKLPIAGSKDSLSLSRYEGKKILIVNTASQSEYAKQFAELERLYQQFKDSGLVVIACPSNSYAREPLRNDVIANWYSERHKISFTVTERMETTGEKADPLYAWFSDKRKNGVGNIRLRGDFAKLLINAKGQIIGYFDGSISALDPTLLKAIRIN
jgi:glutathione peroxidase